MHKHFVLSGNKLRDQYLDSSYSLTDDVVWLLTELNQQPDVIRLTSIISEKKHISPEEAKGYIYELFAHLAEFGGIRIKLDRSFSLGERIRFGIQWRRRHSSTVQGFALAVLRAYGVIMVAMLAVGLYLWLQSNSVPYLQILFLAPVCMVASFVIHELGHLGAARAYHVRTALLSKFSYLAIMYKKPSIAKTRIISLAGPVAASVICAIGCLFSEGLFSIMWAGFGIIHALNVLPFSADGRAIWKKS